MEGVMRRWNVHWILFVGLAVCLPIFHPCELSGQSADGGSIKPLVQRIKENPKDSGAWKRLGSILLNSNRYDMALKCFERSVKLDPSDAESLLLTGQAYEGKKQNTRALAVYAKYEELEASEFRDRMQERYLLLKRETADQEAKNLLLQEEAIGTDKVLPQAVAVLPFAVVGAQPNLAPLGKGVAEMLISDLSQIPSLKLIERIRVQSLFDEMALGQAGLVAESDAAKFGKMLAAGRVVRGGLAVSAQNKVRIEAALENIVQLKSEKSVSVTDAFDNLFRVEKDLVFKMLGKLGVDPTPQERQRILKVPTQNMQAFIAYCNGLDLEDKGEFQKAAAQFQKAVRLDPQYSKASQKLNDAQALERAATPERFRPEDAGGKDFERAGVSGFDPEALVSERLNTEQRNLGSNFMLGKDVRTAQETDAGTTGEVIDNLVGGADLPTPPAPPPSIPLN
jgi:tetratricopeptide (TPR) repeat protein